jgi:hypothetical protein
VVCEYSDGFYAEFVTSYLPDEREWEKPLFKRRLKRDDRNNPRVDSASKTCKSTPIRGHRVHRYNQVIDRGGVPRAGLAASPMSHKMYYVSKPGLAQGFRKSTADIHCCGNPCGKPVALAISHPKLRAQ